jgi:hypothetical protein
MRGKDAGTTSAVPRERTEPVTRTGRDAGLFQCLVVSVDAPRRDALASAAADEGWHPVVCADARNASAASRRLLLGLALIDLERPGGGTPSEFCELTRQLAAAPELLVVVCGHQDDRREEIWARGLGTWLYLPGIGPRDQVATICREAMTVSRRLTARTPLETHLEQARQEQPGRNR